MVDIELEKYMEESRKLQAEWKEGDPWPVRSELDDTTGCVWIATDGHDIIGACETLHRIGELIRERCETPDEMREWAIRAYKIIKEL